MELTGSSSIWIFPFPTTICFFIQATIAAILLASWRFQPIDLLLYNKPLLIPLKAVTSAVFDHGVHSEGMARE